MSDRRGTITCVRCGLAESGRYTTGMTKYCYKCSLVVRNENSARYAAKRRATDDRLARAMAVLRSLRLKLLDRVPMDADERATAVNRIDALLKEDA